MALAGDRIKLGAVWVYPGVWGYNGHVQQVDCSPHCHQQIPKEEDNLRLLVPFFLCLPPLYLREPNSHSIAGAVSGIRLEERLLLGYEHRYFAVQFALWPGQGIWAHPPELQVLRCTWILPKCLHSSVSLPASHFTAAITHVGGDIRAV